MDIMKNEGFTITSIPYSPKNVIIEKGGETYLLLDPDTPNWIVVNAVGKDVVTLCDGTHTAKEITEILCRKYDEFYEESVENILSFMNELRGKRFLQDFPFPAPDRLDKENLPLMDVWINVTNKCNLRCIHCHLDSGRPFKNEMTREEITGLIDGIKNLGMKKLVISGGEPFVRSDILDILEYAHKRGVKMIRVITNGTLIDDKTARALSELEVNVQVSLDGAHERTHDSIRGKGTFKKTINGMKNLLKSNTDFYVCMTLMKRNMGEIKDMVSFLETLEVSALHFSILQNKGRAEKNESVVGFDNREFISVIGEIQDISKQTSLRITSEESIRMKIEKNFKNDLCGAGSSVISIAADGNVYPCAGLHEEEFSAGNIRNQNIEEIWKKSDVLRKLRSLSVLDIAKCRTCELKFICGGGCHVDKYKLHGCLDIPSVRCEAEREIYWNTLKGKMRIKNGE